MTLILSASLVGIGVSLYVEQFLYDGDELRVWGWSS